MPASPLQIRRFGLLPRVRAAAGSALLLASLIPAASAPAVLASHTPTPSSVTIAGDLQSELGCPGDWQPDCAASHLAYDATDDVWQGTLSVPAGSFQYKAALNDGWDESYGLHGGPDNIPLNLGSTRDVKFYYDHKSHWITDNVNSVIAVAPGDFQSELGCPGDWQPDCLRSWLQDPDGDGVYTFETTALQAGFVPPGPGGYAFRARARDWVGHQQPWRDAEDARIQVEP